MGRREDQAAEQRYAEVTGSEITDEARRIREQLRAAVPKEPLCGEQYGQRGLSEQS